MDPSKIEFVLEKLNSHHPNIPFRHKIEENRKIMFLDVLITRTENDKLNTTVLEKKLMQICIELGINMHPHNENENIKESDPKINFDLFR